MSSQLRYFFLIPLFLICCTPIFAQDAGIKNLQKQIQNKSLQPDSIASIYRQLTHLYSKKRDTDKALEMAQQELNLRLNLKQELKLAEVYFNIASLHRAMAAYQKSLESAHQALKIYEAKLGKNDAESIGVCRFLAQTYFLKDDYPAAIQFAQKALSALHQQKKVQPSDEINLLVLLGSLYNKKADYQQAQNYLLKAKDFYYKYETVLSSDFIARIYNDLAALKQEQQAILEALSYYQEIVKIRTKLHDENHFSLQKTYTNIGLCYYRLEDYSKALFYHRKSLAILAKNYGEKHDLVAFTHNHIGGTFQMMGQLDSAQFHLLKSINIYRNVLGNDSPHSVVPLWLLGTVFLQEKSYFKAQVCLEKSIAIQEKNFGKKHPDLAKMYFHLVVLEEEQSNDAKAFLYAQTAHQANNLNQLCLDKPLRLSLINAQLHISLKLSEKEQLQSFPLLDEIQIAVAAVLVELQSATDQKNLIQNLRELCENGIQLCYKLHQLQPHKKYLDKAFELIEYNKAVLLSIQIKQEYYHQQKQDSSTMLKQQILSELQFLEQEWKKAELENNTAQAQVLQQKIFEKHQILEQYSSKVFKQLHYHSPIQMSDLQKQLSAQQTVVNYFYGKQHLYILHFTKDRANLDEVSLDFEKDKAVFSEHLLDLKKSKNKLKNACQTFDQAAFALYQELLPKQATAELLLIPDGQLCYLPFEALSTEKKPQAKGYHELKYALYKHVIHYAYSATSYYYQQFKHTNRQQAQILGFAPDYEAEQQLSNLRENATEIEFLETNFNGDFYYKNAAQKNTFQTQSPHFGILHLALHGYADNHQLQQAQLFFSNTGKDSLTGILYPHEIVSLPLKADFVVLSACQTAIGYWQEGEGIMSLARDFMYAGAPSVLTTLWQINDKASSWLMQDFYTNLQTMPKHQALQLAKRNYIQQASALTAHPYFWSSFILLGNSAQLDIAPVSCINLWNVVVLGFIFCIIILSCRKFKKL